MIYRTPRWASSAPNTGFYHGYMPADSETFANYMRALIARYGPMGSFWTENRDLPKVPVREWQIYNEPTRLGNLENQPAERYYIPLLRTAYRAIHAADRGATVVAAGLHNVSWETLARLYRHGLKGTFDVAAIHVYTSTVKRVLEIVREAERIGYDSVWAAEAYGSDAATVLAWLAAGTERIKLGAAIFQMPGRTAAMTAMTAATLDQLSSGRFLLGLGPSGPQVSEGWHGVRFTDPLGRTREYVAIVRAALARERLTYSGTHWTLPLPDGPGKALKLMIAPVQERMPIYIAAIGPKNTQLVGEIADGWLPVFFSPEHVEGSRALLEEGAARSGRSLENFDIAPTVQVSIDDDVDRARDSMRPFIALYVGGMGSRERNFYNALVQRYGFEDAAREIQDLYLDGKKDEAAAAIPPELIDVVSLVGPRERVMERLEVYRSAGVGTLIVSPMEFDLERRKHTIRELAEML
jgi:F420-dependent oxidoreductase-like protein